MASKKRCLMDRCVHFKNTNGWKAIIFVISLYLSSKVHGTVYTVCVKTDTNTASIPLNCSRNEKIHVISELYGRRPSEENCTIVTADSNTKLFDTSKNGLIVNCNGYKQCTEKAACDTNCNGSGNAFEIAYECVEDNNDLCSFLYNTGHLPSLYLHSPGFPKGPKEEQSCECTVSGQSLDVLMIQHSGRQGVLQINTTGDDNITWTSIYTQFNRKIASNARRIVISYGNQANLTFWLDITGNITHVTCSNSATPTETTESTGMMIKPVSSTKMTPSSPSFQTVMTTSSLYSTDTETTANSNNSYTTTDRGRSSEEDVEDSTLSETTFSTDDRRSTDPEDEDVEDSTLSETTFSKDDRRSTAPEEHVSLTSTFDDSNAKKTTAADMSLNDSRSDFILILGTVSGGVFLLIVIIITTACVCRKKRMTKQTMKSESDIQLPSDYNKHNTVSISNQPEIMSSTSNTDMPNPYQGLNDQTGNTHIYDNKVFEEDRGLFLSECMVDNELYHSNTSHCLAYDGGEDDDQELEMVANDLYHTYQAGSEDDTGPQSYPHVNANNPPDNTDDDDEEGEDVEEEDEKDSPMFNFYHTLESDVTGVSGSQDVFDDVDENVMVANDLYHSYQNPENVSIPQDIEDREEMVLEENDLYYSRNTSVV